MNATDRRVSTRPPTQVQHTLSMTVCQRCADDLANRRQHIFIRLPLDGHAACTHVAIAREWFEVTPAGRAALAEPATEVNAHE